jgi:hypothetical protein
MLKAPENLNPTDAASRCPYCRAVPGECICLAEPVFMPPTPRATEPDDSAARIAELEAELNATRGSRDAIRATLDAWGRRR